MRSLNFYLIHFGTKPLLLTLEKTIFFKKVFANQQYAHILKGLIQDIYHIQFKSIQIKLPTILRLFMN